jgi:gliding motility-associatede transport system auxiliary component
LAQDRDMIAIGPRDQSVRPFVPNPIQERTLLYVQVFFLPAVVLVAGVNVWRKRRRL